MINVTSIQIYFKCTRANDVIPDFLPLPPSHTLHTPPPPSHPPTLIFTSPFPSHALSLFLGCCSPHPCPLTFPYFPVILSSRFFIIASPFQLSFSFLVLPLPLYPPPHFPSFPPHCTLPTHRRWRLGASPKTNTTWPIRSRAEPSLSLNWLGSGAGEDEGHALLPRPQKR